MRGIILCIFLATIALTTQAQQAMPVKWTFDVQKIDKQSYELVITADVEDGWYLYSQYLESDEGPIATSFSFEGVEELVGKTSEAGQKKEGYDEMFEMNIVKFKNKVKFIQKIKVNKKATSISGIVEFMTCDDTRCLPPTEVPFTVHLK